jgi:NTP pyrophosphatase (non-canonical NTP hydrolase)
MTDIRDLEELKIRLREFAAERDWEKFHSPKNLAMALIVEAAELVEQFQWLTEAESHQLTIDRLSAVETELADILIYLVRIADKTGVDLLAAATGKLHVNRKKYPANRVRSSAKKYTEY